MGLCGALPPRRVSRPDVVTVPEGGWPPERPPQRLQDLGPPVEHVYEVVNEGPSSISQGSLELRCPLRYRGLPLLLVTAHSGPPNCSSSHPMDGGGAEEQEQGLAPHVLQRRDTGGSGDTSRRDPPVLPHTLGCPEAECFLLSCPMGALERQQRVSLSLRFRLRGAPARPVRELHPPHTHSEPYGDPEPPPPTPRRPWDPLGCSGTAMGALWVL
ncbi:integrin alpha-5-like, partial [Pezoporus occidentalis]|uniref:integrin alpha-5-like n=1 Tax=Pezoporus occidentalis TaxID=407982 RepID=UPI002F90B6F8